MKRNLFTIAALAASLTLSAQYTQTLPLDYNDFFRVEAIAEEGNSLERGAYTSTSQGSGAPLLVDQWNCSGKASDQAGSSPALSASTLQYGDYIDNKKGSEISLLDLGGSSLIRSSIYSLKSDYTYSDAPYYLAALVQITGATGKGDFLAFDGNYTANAQRARLYTNKSGSGYCLGLGWNGEPTIWSSEFAFGSTHLVVIKVTPNKGGGEETADFFLDPDLDATEANNTPLATLSGGTGLKSVRGITVRQRTKIAGSVAGLRFGASWADVVKKAVAGLPALSAPEVGNASDIMAESFTANWTAVANAVGYKVEVYAGEVRIADASVNDPDATSMVIYNMPVATSLTYTVTALGDKVAYDNSPASQPSTAFATTQAPESLVLLPSAEQWEAYGMDKGTYTAGSLPSSRANGYEFVQAYIERSIDEEGKSFSIENTLTGERFTARVVIDKQKNSSCIILPAVLSAARVDIYMNAGSDGKKMNVEQYDFATSTWTLLAELSVNKALAVFSVTPSAGVVKLRLINPDTSTKYVWKVITYSAEPAVLDVPVLNPATDITANSFTASWAAVTAAAGYRLIVYNNESLVIKRLTLSAEETSVTISELTPETTYTYKVSAIGDDVATTNSNLSEAATVTTAAAGPATALDETALQTPARKVIINGEILIERDGALFTVTGIELK